MSNYGANSVSVILVDGYDVTPGPMTDVHDEVQALTELSHGLGDTWQKNAYTNLRRFMLGMKGFYDDTTGSVRDAFNDSKNGLLRIIVYCLEGNTIAKSFQGFEGAGENSWKRFPSLGVLDKVEVGFASGGGHYEVGQILHTFSTEAGATGDTKSTPADGNTDSHRTNFPISGSTKANPCAITTPVPHGLVSNDVIFISSNSLAGPAINGQEVVTVTSTTTFTVPVNTAGSSGAGNDGSFIQVDSDNGGAAYLEVQALTLGGYTDWAPLLLHSSDNITYTTLGTWTVVTSAPSAQRLVVAAATKVKRYLAISWTYDGAGAGQSVKFFAGFARAH